jgi:hypothetical protein
MAPGIYRFPPEWLRGEAACAARHSGPGSALWSRPRVAVSSGPGAASISSSERIAKKDLPKRPSAGYKYSCSELLRWPVLKWPRLAGFQVATEGDFPEVGQVLEDLGPIPNRSEVHPL